jgi:hypothetical protein
MGGVGFFADDIVRGIYRAIQRSRRRNSALKWPIADATVTRFEAFDEFWNAFRPVVSYSYQVNGATCYGVVKGTSINRELVDKVGDAVETLPGLSVRYDPNDGSLSRVLNEDNPKLPFWVDLNEGK